MKDAVMTPSLSARIIRFFYTNFYLAVLIIPIFFHPLYAHTPLKLSVILENSERKEDIKTKIQTLKLKSTDPLKIGAVQRGNKLYVAIDTSVLMDFSDATPTPDGFFNQIKQMDIADSGIMEIDLANSPRIELANEKDGWVIKFSNLRDNAPFETTQTDLHKITIQQTGDGKPYLNMELTKPSVIYAIQDPLTNFPLAIVPTETPFLLSKPEKYPDLEILPSLCGVGILSKTDDLIVTLDQNNVQVGTIEGIYISSDQDKQIKRTVGKPEPLLFRDADFTLDQKPVHTARELYAKSLKEKEAIEQLEKIKFSESDDETKRDILKLPGSLYIKNKEYEKAIKAYQEVLNTLSPMSSPNSESEDIYKLLTDTYADALLQKNFSNPIDFVSFYKNYIQYLPQDERKKRILEKVLYIYDEMGLVDDTEQLIHLLNTEFQSNDLDDDLGMDRKFLLAKVYLIKKEYENILNILSDDEKIPNQKEILLQIALEKKDWSAYQQILKEEIHHTPLSATLSEDEILSYTLAAYNTQDEDELAYLRDHVEESLKTKENKALFRLLTQKQEFSVFTDETVMQALDETQKYADLAREYMKGLK